MLWTALKCRCVPQETNIRESCTRIEEDRRVWREKAQESNKNNEVFVQSIVCEGRTIYVPRRCMQCFDAPCRKLCPFDAIERSDEGALSINPNVCFGGAKCRDVCPWRIPQRQTGHLPQSRAQIRGRRHHVQVRLLSRASCPRRVLLFQIFFCLNTFYYKPPIISFWSKIIMNTFY